MAGASVTTRPPSISGNERRLVGRRPFSSPSPGQRPGDGGDHAADRPNGPTVHRIWRRLVGPLDRPNTVCYGLDPQGVVLGWVNGSWTLFWFQRFGASWRRIGTLGLKFPVHTESAQFDESHIFLSHAGFVVPSGRQCQGVRQLPQRVRKRQRLCECRLEHQSDAGQFVARGGGECGPSGLRWARHRGSRHRQL